MRAVTMFSFVIFGVLAAAGALPTEHQRIVGGSVTTIDQYPNAVSMLVLWPWGSYYQNCGGAIINSRSILSAAHCYYNDRVDEWRARVGSTNANSGGTVYVLSQVIMHPNFVRATLDNDVAVLHVATPFTYGTLVQPASIAGSAYNVADNTEVWAVGWGRTSFYGSSSEQLRHVQIWTINQAICASRYTELGRTVNDNMLCSGWLDVGGRDQCSGDSGGPLYHNNVIIGICSWGEQCALARYPGVNTRVSRYTAWIQANA